MARPDRDDLVAALLATQPKFYRERKPDQALARAQQLASGALSNWPAQPVRERRLGAAMTVVDRGDVEEVVLAAERHSIDIEAAGVVLHAVYRETPDGLGRLDLRIDPLGQAYMSRLRVTEFGHHDVQAVVSIQGRPTNEEGD